MMYKFMELQTYSDKEKEENSQDKVQEVQKDEVADVDLGIKQ